MTESAERLGARLGARIIPGWATVDLDRADREVILQRGWAPALAAPDDVLLGARTRVAASADGSDMIVLLEPASEGRLGASLVRFAEGFVVEYLVVRNLDQAIAVAHAGGVKLSSPASGPFGRERLVAGSPRWGPHVILSDDAAQPGQRDRAVTIEA